MPEDPYIKNPTDGGLLLADTAGDLVSMHGPQFKTIADGVEGAGRQYVTDYVALGVITGPNKGQTFAAGSYPAVIPDVGPRRVAE